MFYLAIKEKGFLAKKENDSFGLILEVFFVKMVKNENKKSLFSFAARPNKIPGKKKGNVLFFSREKPYQPNRKRGKAGFRVGKETKKEKFFRN